MFRTLLTVAALLTCISVLHAETYSCSIYTDKGLIKPTHIKDAGFSRNVPAFDIEENQEASFVIAEGKSVYEFNFTITTSHDILVTDPSEQLACVSKKKVMDYNKMLLTVDCVDSKNDAPVFSGDCQEVTVWK